MRSARRPGYTLLEITLVVMLMGIMAALAVPTMDSMYDDVKIKAAADNFRTALVTARSRAIDEGQPYRVSVVPGTGRYRIAPHAGSFWNGGSSDSLQTTASGTESLVDEGELAGGILFKIGMATSTDNITPSNSAPQPGAQAQSADSGQWVTQATFLPDGTALDDMSMTLNKTGSRPLVLELRALTGSVTVNYLEAGNGQP